MRFSLKWILAATAYVAIAAAAFGQPDWLWADALWCIAILSNVYAATLATFVRGRRRAAALGFVGGSLGFTAFLFGSYGLAGQVGGTGFYPVDDVFLVLGINAASGGPMDLMRLRAGNAVATLLFGIVGSLVGLIAFRAADYGESAA